MASLMVRIGGSAKGLFKTLGKAKREVKSWSRSIENAIKPAKNIALGVGLIGGALATGIIGLAKYAGMMQQTQLAMETFLGSAEKAKSLISDLRQFADVTPFDTGTVIKAGKLLAGAGFEAMKVTGIVKMLGDVSAGTGKDLVELSAIYSKSMNKNKVMTRDLNQLIQAGVPIVARLAEQMGKNKDQVFELAERGKIKFKDLQKVFRAMTTEGGIYAGLMAKQAQTLLGRWSTLEGKIQNLSTDVGGPLLGSMTSITDTLIDWVAQARNMSGPLGLMLKNVQAIAAIMETTREGENFLGVKGKAGFETNFLDTAADALASTSFGVGGFEVNPFAAIGRGAQALGFGAQAKGEAFMADIDSKRSVEVLELIAQNTAEAAANTQGSTF